MFKLLPRSTIVCPILLILVILFAIGRFVFGYTEPNQNPPGGNVAAPLNVGVSAQTKLGDLRIQDGVFEIGGSIGRPVYKLVNSGGTLRFNCTNASIADCVDTVNPDKKTRLVIGQDGNVGIGTTGPGAKLDIAVGTGQCCAPQTPNLSLGQLSNSNGQMAWLQFHNGGEAEAYLRLAGGGSGARAGQRRLEVGDSQGQNTSLWVQGDLALSGKHALRGNDSWLRLNQDGAFTSGTHTPGLFTSTSLNVGGAGGWGNPGGGNAWITGNLGIGTTDLSAKLNVNGPVNISGMLTVPLIQDLNNSTFFVNPSGLSQISRLSVNTLPSTNAPSATIFAHPNNYHLQLPARNNAATGFYIYAHNGTSCPSGKAIAGYISPMQAHQPVGSANRLCVVEY